MDTETPHETATRNGRFPSIGCLIGVFLVLALIVVALLPALNTSRPRSPRRACEYRMRQVSAALMSYAKVHKRFPPPCMFDKDGKPMHSWRVLILPFLEENIAYNAYDFKQPWNSPHNWKVIESVDPYLFSCPTAHGEPRETNYLAVVGDETVWPMGRIDRITNAMVIDSAYRHSRNWKGVQVDKITDGVEHTILLVEVAHSGIHWAEPRDLPLAQAIQGINPPHVSFSISSDHQIGLDDTGGAHVGICNGRVELLPSSISVEVLRALLTRDGGELLTRDHSDGSFLLAPDANP